MWILSVLLIPITLFHIFRFLLWDCDGRKYSYYIEVSVDNAEWHKVADKTSESCK